MSSEETPEYLFFREITLNVSSEWPMQQLFGLQGLFVRSNESPLP